MTINAGVWVIEQINSLKGRTRTNMLWAYPYPAGTPNQEALAKHKHQFAIC